MTALPPLASGALPPQSATPAATLAILEAPAELNALPAGTLITGAVVATVDGVMTLKTESGMIMARNAGVSGVALPKDALVSLLVQTAAPGLALRIIQVVLPQGGQDPSAPLQAQPAAFREGFVDRQAIATSAVSMAAAARPRIEAIVLRPLAGATFIPAGGRAPAADAGPTAPPMFPADTRLTLRMLGSAPEHPPAGDGSPFSRLGASQIITARLVRTDGANRPLLTSSAGLLVLGTPVSLPRGWSGEFEILNASPPLDAASNGLAAPGATDGSRTGSWGTFGDVLVCLSENDPTAAGRISQAVLPQPTSSLAANLLKVLGLLRGGDIRKWIGGEAYQNLARTRPELLERLAADIQKLSPGPDGNAGNDWRTYIIPMIADGALTTIRMRIRSGVRQNEKGGAADSDSTRFVLDLALSRLGPMQIDGLVQARGRQLDLMVRTERPLAAEVQGGIRHILLEAGALTGLRGAVGFRAAPVPFLDADTLPPVNARPRSSLVI